VRPARQFEVVVEAVGDGRANGVVRPGPKSGDGLRQYVSTGVTDDLATMVALGRHDRDGGAVGQRRREIRQLAVDLGREGVFRQAFADCAREVVGRGTFRERAPTAVRELNFDVRHFGHSLSNVNA
jgi:hypothetical protein